MYITRLSMFLCGFFFTNETLNFTSIQGKHDPLAEFYSKRQVLSVSNYPPPPPTNAPFSKMAKVEH